MVSQSLLIIPVAGGQLSQARSGLSWRHGHASPLPTSPLRGKVVMESPGKDIGYHMHADGFHKDLSEWTESRTISLNPSVGVKWEGR